MKSEVIHTIKAQLDIGEIRIIKKAMEIIIEIQKTLRENECDTITDNNGSATDYDHLEEILDTLYVVMDMEEMY